MHDRAVAAALFPAHAGMNRLGVNSVCIMPPVPRTRGDEPQQEQVLRHLGDCSPHTRG